LIIDYPHNRLYAIPDDAAVKKPIEKDRIGLVFDRKSTDAFAVAFVAPGSPAEAAGFKKGEKIALIDGKPLTAWPAQAIIAFQMDDAGTVHTLQMMDGTVRRRTFLMTDQSSYQILRIAERSDALENAGSLFALIPCLNRATVQGDLMPVVRVLSPENTGAPSER
jgi:predicted metalloprotease with PDZ domain